MIDVSIVLTVYNAESYIEGCLDMITGQTLRNIQIICVDDESTDNSSQIIEQKCARTNIRTYEVTEEDVV